MYVALIYFSLFYNFSTSAYFIQFVGSISNFRLSLNFSSNIYILFQHNLSDFYHIARLLNKGYLLASMVQLRTFNIWKSPFEPFILRV